MIKVRCFLFDHRTGGPSIRVAHVYDILRMDSAFDLAVVFPQEGSATKMLRERGIAVDILPTRKPVMPSKFWHFLKFIARSPFDYIRIRRYLKHENIDIVHINGAFDMLPALAARSVGVKVVWHLNDMLFSRRVASKAGLLIKKVATRIAVTSLPVADHYGIAREQTDRLPVPVAKALLETGTLRHLPSDRPLMIGHLANWNPLKGQDFFINMVARLRDTGHNIRASLHGRQLETQKAYCKRVQSLIDQRGLGEHVTSHGFTTDIADALAKMDLLVISSRSESGPLVCVEAMAVGLPVVSANVGDVQMMLGSGDEERAGYIFNVGDEDGAVEAVDRIIGSEKTYSAASNAGLNRSRNHFSAELIADLHSSLYKACMQDHAKSGIIPASPMKSRF